MALALLVSFQKQKQKLE